MKQVTKKFTALGLCMLTMSTSISPLMTQVQASAIVSQEVANDLTPAISSVAYSDLVLGDGAVNFKVNLPEGVKLTTSNPSLFSTYVTQNYDISISEGVATSKSFFVINVNWANQGVAYNGNWEFNIDGKAFTDGKARSFEIEVTNDLVAGTPVVYTNVDQGVTVEQLNQGFDLVMNIRNARFNTSCFGNLIRVSMMNTSNIYGIYPLAYCNSLNQSQVKMYVQAMNGVESWKTHFEFKLEGDAIYSSVPITVRIPIIR
ncbi:MAG TPA: hypothetical protein DCY20_04895 [Firmicutes bacterium]|nr:hypothetical protein [Bacillota bacterium]